MGVPGPVDADPAAGVAAGGVVARGLLQRLRRSREATSGFPREEEVGTSVISSGCL